MRSEGPTRRLVLVGGGHAHVQVLRSLAMRPRPHLHVTLITDAVHAVYSGMVPGHVAGRYTAAELSIDLVPLARRAGAALVLSAAERVDPDRQEVHLVGPRPPVPYDTCSLDIGSTVSLDGATGAREHAIATRPIHLLEHRLAARLAEPRTGPVHVVVVGAGAAGVELAFAMGARLRRAGTAHSITLISSADGPVVGGGARGKARVLAALAARSVRFVGGQQVRRVGPTSVELEDGTQLPSTATIWATGAAAHPFASQSGLPCSPEGWVRTEATLQVRGHQNLFAAGDCAVLADGPRVPRAGVYAVRAGPVLIHNLLDAAAPDDRTPFRPQSTFLALLDTGDGGAVGTWGAWAWESRALGRLKSWIDRGFMSRFQVLDPKGQVRPEFEAGMPPMADEMVCGGCAAKLADAPLRRALSALPPPPPDPDVLAGVHASDDVAVLHHRGGILVQSVDAFPAFTDDPWLVGQVAAVNALNDVYAKGAIPRFALAVVEVPQRHGEGVLTAALAGVRAVLDPAKVSLVGGHTTVGDGLRIGLAVTGTPAPNRDLWPTRGAQLGDALILSRPLGTGVLLHADMAGRATGPWVEALHRHLTTSNQAAVEALAGFEIHAATDVTGFGLARHLRTMLPAEGACGTLWLSALPLLAGVAPLLALGERSTFHAQNRLDPPELELAPPVRRDPLHEVLFDPQTGGGMLVALPKAQAESAVRALRAVGCHDAVVVGVIEASEGGVRVRLVASAAALACAGTDELSQN